MKTVFINCSPKKKFSASAYFLKTLSLFIKGQKVTKQLRNKSDFAGILQELKDADSVIFAMPLYVDSPPSHVLVFLKQAQEYFVENNVSLNVYCIANNGFIEGKQNESLMQIMENFCLRSKVIWCGGLGIGGGVMLNVTRIILFVLMALFVILYLFNGIKTGQFWDTGYLKAFFENAWMVLFFQLGAWAYLIKMSISINNKVNFGKHYTRALVFSFIFVIFANLFFIITSLIEGGFFKGLLAKK